MEDYFKKQSIHCQGRISMDIDQQGNLYTVGSDDILFSRNISNDTHSTIDINLTGKESYSCLAIDHREEKTLFLGRPNGIDKLKYGADNQPQELLAVTGQVNSLSCFGQLLAVGSQDSFALVMNLQTKKTVKCRPGHSSAVINVQFCSNGSYLCSTSSDGSIKIYKFDSKLDPQLIFTYVFSTETVSYPTQPAINLTSSAIALPGRPFLQLLQHQQLTFRQQNIQIIRHGNKNIVVCHWQSDNLLITGSQDNQIILWNMFSTSKITAIPDCSINIMRRYGDTFYGVDSLGYLYDFYRPELLSVKIERVQKEIEPVEEPEQPIEEVNQVPVQQPQILRKTQPPHIDLVRCLPQDSVMEACQKSTSSRFLVYNSIGCVYEVPNNGIPIAEVQFHDKSIIFSKQDGLHGKQVNVVSLGNCQVAYVSDQEVGYIGQTTWSIDTTVTMIDVALGNSWVAALSQDDIYILDFAGNCTRRISVDRQYVAMRAYENLLVLLYHDSIPLQGNQSLRMRIYVVDGTIGLQEEIAVPLSQGSVLQHFMFSSKGMLVSQDSHNKIRAYDMVQHEWLTIYDMNMNPEEARQNMWLIDVCNDNIIAFLFPEGQTEPSVFPRSIPRTIRINPPILHINTSYAERYGMLLWQQAKINHERFRCREWYMYKYSRKKQHLLYSQSQSILSEEEIKERQAKVELQAVEIVKLMIGAAESKKALYFCKSFIKLNKQAALQVFDEADGCGPLAGKLREYYKQKKEIESRLHKRVETRPILLSLDKQILRNVGGLNLPEWNCRADRPYKLPMSLSQRQQKLDEQFRKLAD